MASQITVRLFEPSDLDAVRSIIERAGRDGELVGFHASEVRDWVRSIPEVAERTWVAVMDETVIGVLCIPFDAVVVTPEYRRRGVGRRLVETVRAVQLHFELSQWSGSPETAAFLQTVGFRFDHMLVRMVRTGSQLPSKPNLPSGFSMRTYRHEEFDDYFDLLDRSFADHPTPLVLDRERVRTVHAKPEFNPASIHLVVQDGEPDRLAAFVRLRKSESVDGAPVGTVALLGVDPEYRARGLARALLRSGIREFIAIGIDTIDIEVVSNNDRALPLYTSEGFKPVLSWPYWVPDDTRLS